ncbi:MAG: hypothetical protein ABIQ81_02895, partial [Novosphingobium sp.]
RNLTNWIWGLASVLLLFVVVAHAIAPVEPEHGRARGSAFSASTEEVSLKSGVRTFATREIVRAEPLAPVPPAPALVTLVTDQPAPAVLRGFAGIVPVLASTVLGPISPRAPPFA